MQETDVKKIRIVAGYGRSGTTWVQDAIAIEHGLRAVFEPLQPDVVSGAERYANTFRHADEEDPQLLRFLGRYFAGDFHSLWVDYRIRRDLLWSGAEELRLTDQISRCRRRLVDAGKNLHRYRGQRHRPGRIAKLVRANMMLSFLARNYGGQIVFLIRHPAAVVMSQMKRPQVWKPLQRVAAMQTDAALLEQLTDATRKTLFESLDEVQALALCWSIENTIALAQCEASDIAIVHYEHLLERGESEWGRIATALDLPGIPDQSVVSKPSQQTWGDKLENAEQLKKYAMWMERIDDSTRDRIQDMLDKSGFSRYHVSQPMPVAEGPSP